MAKRNLEYENFNNLMQQLVKVSHSELKATLDAEKAEKAEKRKLPKCKDAKPDA